MARLGVMLAMVVALAGCGAKVEDAAGAIGKVKPGDLKKPGAAADGGSSSCGTTQVPCGSGCCDKETEICGDGKCHSRSEGVAKVESASP